jgi:hypothetical protein
MMPKKMTHKIIAGVLVLLVVYCLDKWAVRVATRILGNPTETDVEFAILRCLIFWGLFRFGIACIEGVDKLLEFLVKRR